MIRSAARQGRKVERALRRSLGPRALASPVVPRPRLRATRRRSRLTDVLVSSDLTPKYLGAWDVTRRMWNEVAGLRAHLVLIADAADVPPALADDPDVHVFEPISGLHTALQAQCIRLLYPAVLDTEGAVLISDVDMVPLSRRYFHDPIERVDERHFVAYRDVLLRDAQIPICYNAALPAVWGDVFQARSPDDVRRRLSEWGEGLVYDGRHSGHGWLTDQLILYRTLLERGREHRDVWILRDEASGFERLLRRHAPLENAERDGIRRGRYADFHIRIPYDEHRALNDEVVALALAGRGRDDAGVGDTIAE